MRKLYTISIIALLLISVAVAIAPVKAYPDNVNFYMDTPAGQGTTNPAPDYYSVTYGSAQYLYAYPKTGYTFKNWTIYNATSTSLLSTSQTVYVSFNGGYSQAGATFHIIAYFTGTNITEPVVTHPDYVSLWVAKDGYGTVSPGEDYFTYPWGYRLTLVASPLGGGHFINWTVSNSTTSSLLSTSPTYSFTLNGAYSQAELTGDTNFTIRGYFSLPEPAPTPTPPTYVNIWTAIDGNGNATIEQGGMYNTFPDYSSYLFGTIVHLVATPDPGYVFLYWEAGNDTMSTVFSTAPTTSAVLSGLYSWTGYLNFTAHFNYPGYVPSASPTGPPAPVGVTSPDPTASSPFISAIVAFIIMFIGAMVGVLVLGRTGFVLGWLIMLIILSIAATASGFTVIPSWTVLVGALGLAAIFYFVIIRGKSSGGAGT